MFFILSKLLLFLLKPAFWIALFMILAFVTGDEKRRKRMLLISIIFVFFFGNKIIFNTIIRGYETPMTTLGPDENYDVAIVLGGFSGEDLSRNRLQFNEAADRFIYGLQLLNQNKVKALIVSGGNANIVNKEAGEAKPAAALLKQLKADSTKIFFEDYSRNTYENARFSSELMKHKGFAGKKILLITSAFHMPRALKCFQKKRLDVTPYPVHFSSIPASYYSWYEWFIPDAYTLYKWDYLLKEWMGLLAYKIQGYI